LLKVRVIFFFAYLRMSIKNKLNKLLVITAMAISIDTSD
jgi:hypothetical protein